MGHNFYVPFSFVVSAHTRKREITRDQRNKMCLEWPRASKLYHEFVNFFKFQKAEHFAQKAIQGKKQYFPPKALPVMLTPIITSNFTAKSVFPQVKPTLTLSQVNNNNKIYNVNCEKLNVAIHINV